MRFGKFLPFLALGILVLYQAGLLQATPFSSDSEDTSNPASLNEEEDLLLAILVKELLKKMAREKEQVTAGSSFTAQKRACNTGTCLTQKLAGLLSRSGSVAHKNLLPSSMVSNAAPRKARDLDA
ncbi:PREDICTED: calcitonin gene-related peptide 1-like [Miniopterus natalensis]|uniref:calcitonin gene-related peptide 1-like n=1 Tax=Miniopterus natalensis TaxID=291302 RepID=UPI0007A6D997|nr:PREDICTED: calcitonin gene-related peptide 1-like [Miniopterus natalensis]